MKKTILVALWMACFVSTAQADFVTFDFDAVGGTHSSTNIESYMESIYLSDITVTGAWCYAQGGVPGLGNASGDRYVGVHMTAPVTHSFSISFNDEAITAASFDWGRYPASNGPFNATADGVTILSVAGIPANPALGWSGTLDLLALVGHPVTTLTFSGSATSSVGIDNLQVEAVPLPGAILLGMLGLGAAGVKLRRFA
jgi:hypothetical protein